MRGVAVRRETYLPDPDGGIAQIYDFMEAHESADLSRDAPSSYYLAGPALADRVELPVEVYQVLRQVVAALREGLAVTVAPFTQTLTTQQAADLLGVSRPTVIKLLDEGRIQFERVGTHRRVSLQDVLAYRERRRQEQYAALEATSVGLEDEEDLETTLRELREARRAVAKLNRGSKRD
ncbi:helix-turn-helix domain-containing protein [Polymorphospora sp. NPDC051019]|uniref:helix-turn-helix domain-containing protein n=1 Tax=Polymorphospora sp. NPDC051019 TaxID=3155725 RepID=UPI003437A0D7